MGHIAWPAVIIAVVGNGIEGRFHEGGLGVFQPEEKQHE